VNCYFLVNAEKIEVATASRLFVPQNRNEAYELSYLRVPILDAHQQETR
jgi:hypothetical protein